MNTKLVVLLMNDPPSKEKLSQCKNFTDFIKNEQITIEETSKEKSESSLTSLGIFGNNNNLPEENNSSKDPSQSTIGTKKG
jgi:glycine/serine hydroxymethyltransferase